MIWNLPIVQMMSLTFQCKPSNCQSPVHDHHRHDVHHEDHDEDHDEDHEDREDHDEDHDDDFRACPYLRRVCWWTDEIASGLA